MLQSLYLSVLTLPRPQADQGHFPPRVENCKVIHAFQNHLKETRRAGFSQFLHTFKAAAAFYVATPPYWCNVLLLFSKRSRET